MVRASYIDRNLRKKVAVEMREAKECLLVLDKGRMLNKNIARNNNTESNVSTNFLSLYRAFK